MKTKSLRNKILLWAGSICLIALALYAANPSFNDFLTSQFSTTTANKVAIKSGAVVTNVIARAASGVPGLSVEDQSGLGVIFQVRDSVPVTQFWVDLDGSVHATTSLQLLSATANTLSIFDASRNLSSFANGTGVLNNNGSGTFTWFNILGTRNNFSVDQKITGGLQVTGIITNDNLTASSLVQSDANKGLTNIVNAAGVLLNNGSGGFSFSSSPSIIDWPTNALTSASAFPVASGGVYFMTNMGGPLTFTGLSGSDNTHDRWGVALLEPNGGDRTLVIPAAWVVRDGVRTITVTNGVHGVLSVNVFANKLTNATYQAYY